VVIVNGGMGEFAEVARAALEANGFRVARGLGGEKLPRAKPGGVMVASLDEGSGSCSRR
jgi:hypothetical protein